MQHHKIERQVGNCAVLSQPLGCDYDGSEQLGYFAALCIDNNGRRCHASKAAHFIRITKTKTTANAIDTLTAVCQGYSLALEHKEFGHTFGSIESHLVATA